MMWSLGYSSAQPRDTREAKELNNQAVNLVNGSMGDRKALLAALKLLDIAIKADSLCTTCYLNKTTFLFRLGRRIQALKLLEKLAAYFPQRDGYRTMQGQILECMGRLQEAKKRYLQDLQKYDKMLQTGADSVTVSVRLARAFLLMPIKGQKVGIQEYETIASEFPGDTSIATQRITFYAFDRTKFINEFCR